MKAVQIGDYGSNDVVRLVDINTPTPGTGEVLVKVLAAGINPIDWMIRNGAGERMGLALPILLGEEVVGRVEQVGDARTAFKVGDIIYGLVKDGGFAEYAVAKTNEIAVKPQGLGIPEAAAIPLAGLTAWQSIFDLGNLNSKQKILITGASGAVGSLAVQLAKEKGAYVVGTASGKNEAYVRDLGLDEFINYEKQDFAECVNDADIVFDTVGGETYEKSFRIVRKDGIVVTTVAFPNGNEKQRLGIDAKRVSCKPNGGQLTQISELVKAEKLKGRVATIVPFERVKDALQMSESGKTKGKIILQIGY